MAAMRKMQADRARLLLRSAKEWLKRKYRLKIRADHALVREVTKRGHPLRGAVARAYHHEYSPKETYSLAMGLAHAFFPEYFPEQVASSTDMRTNYSKFVKLDRESQDAIEEFYNPLGEGELDPLYVAHRGRVRGVGTAHFERAGIVVNVHPANVGFRGGKPFFFEVAEVNLRKAEEYAEKSLSGLKQKQALEVIGGLKKFIPSQQWGSFVDVHKPQRKEVK